MERQTAHYNVPLIMRELLKGQNLGHSYLEHDTDICID